MSQERSEPGSMERSLIWARSARATKGPAPSKSREQIAAAAVALRDAEGTKAVSMRKVAAVLGLGRHPCTATSIAKTSCMT
jgi:hypothetical protein